MSQPSESSGEAIRLYQPKRRKRAGPILRFSELYVLGGHPYRVVGERWRVEDAANSPSPTIPDPQRPGVVCTLRVVDEVTGAIIPPVSAVEFSRAEGARPAPQASGSFASP